MTILILNKNYIGDQIGKDCTKCKETKLIKEFPKDASKSDGLCPWCKACNSIRKREYYQAHKAESLLYRQKHKKEIAARGKYYYEENKEKINVLKKQYRQEHKEEIAEYNKKYTQTDKGKALRKKGTVKYFKTEKGKIAKRKGSHKRRVQKYNGVYEVFDFKEVFERDGYRCQHCKKKTRPDYKNINHSLYPNLDHIIPLSKGGEHTRLNTQCLCHQCNIEKGNNGNGEQLRLFG